MYHSVFFQDDWKVTERLSLNLGLRYEYEGPTDERYNRNARGFDLASASPIEAQAKAQYAQSPIPEVSPANFNVKGGYLFAGAGSRGFWTADKNNFQPRVGAAYRMFHRTVLRGGWGVYMVPFIIAGANQPGFSQPTNIVPSLDSGLTFVANLMNPFPNGVENPPGAKDGLATFMGRGISFVPLSAANGMSQRWEVGMQHEFRGRWLFEGAYVGSKGYDLATGTNIVDAVPQKYLSTSPERDQPTIDFLGQIVPNPFRNLIAGTGLNGATVGRSQLLRPYPHFTGIGTNRFDGSSIYHSAQVKLEKRFSRGFTALMSYTMSRLLEKASFLNEQDTQYEERLNSADRRHRWVMSGVWELPFGKGHAWGSGWSGVTNTLLGGWQVQGIGQLQTGGPLNFDANYLFRGDRNTVALPSGQRSIDRWFNTDSFERSTARQLGSNYRTAPRQFPGVEVQGLNLWDLSIIKSIAIRESLRLQVRGEFLNAFNHPQFNDPDRTPTNSNFGKSTSQNNLPRNVQIALKLLRRAFRPAPIAGFSLPGAAPSAGRKAGGSQEWPPHTVN
ncbi:MAG: TonB-dependent receptor [Acidobacteria bacterium]|nr:TonB-dependent receptor [Acidobacteriota bacterium]